jgi:hypothetical protein
MSRHRAMALQTKCLSHGVFVESSFRDRQLAEPWNHYVLHSARRACVGRFSTFVGATIAVSGIALSSAGCVLARHRFGQRAGVTSAAMRADSTTRTGSGSTANA